MKIAITGATGFIGKHIIAELLKHPVQIVAIVQEEVPPKFDPSIEVVHLDIEYPPTNVFECIGKPDVLLHLAWGGLPNYRSLHHFEDQLPMQYKFLSDLIKSGLSGLVVAGTCFEYGMQSGQLDETMETCPDNPYAHAKDVLRRQLQFLQKDQEFTFSWARLFYLYGDGQSKKSLLPQLKAAVENGEDTFNMSGGEQLRDYLPIADVAKNLALLALNKADIGIVNICSGKPVSVRTLVEKWISENNWNITLNLGHYPYPDYEPFAFWGNKVKQDDFIKKSTL